MLTIGLALMATAMDDGCLAQVTAQWPGLVEAREESVLIELGDYGSEPKVMPAPVHDKAIAALERLDRLCVGQPEILGNLRALNAALRLEIRDYPGAVAVLNRGGFSTGSPLAGMNARTLLLAAAGERDRAVFDASRVLVRQTHQQIMGGTGWVVVAPFDTPMASVDAYHWPRGGANWLFVGWPIRGGMPVSMIVQTVHYAGSEKPEVDVRLHGCGTSFGVDLPPIAIDASDDVVLAAAHQVFSGPAFAEPDFPVATDVDEKPAKAEPEPVDELALYRSDCVAMEDVLPALATAPQFTGTEYAPATSVFTERQLQIMLVGSPAQQDKAIDYILDHPDAVEPFTLLQPIKALMARGDMLQASFWFYFWQIRTAPWVIYGGAGTVRGALNATLGQPINEWIASDPQAMFDLITRVIAYEKRVPLYAGRPDGVSAADWASGIAKTRADYAKGFAEAFPNTPESRRKLADGRTKNGLTNGPLDHPGAPLRDEWR